MSSISFNAVNVYPDSLEQVFKCLPEEFACLLLASSAVWLVLWDVANIGLLSATWLGAAYGRYTR